MVISENLQRPRSDRARIAALHDLILRQTAMRICLHAIASAWGDIFNEAEAKRSSTIVIPLKFGNSSLSSGSTIEANNTSSPGTATRLVLDLGLFDFANRGEKLY